jgi:hypothetical protein
MKKRFLLLAALAVFATTSIASAQPPRVPKPSCTFVNDRNGGHIVCK